MIEQGVQTHKGKHRLCGKQKIDKSTNHGNGAEKSIARILDALIFAKQTERHGKQVDGAGPQRQFIPAKIQVVHNTIGVVEDVFDKIQCQSGYPQRDECFSRCLFPTF